MDRSEKGAGCLLLKSPSRIGNAGLKEVLRTVDRGIDMSLSQLATIGQNES